MLGNDSNVRRAKFLLLSFLVGVALLAGSIGCGPPSSPGSGGQGSASSSSEIPELTEDIINERINDARVRDVPEETGATPPISWNFDSDEPKQITVVEKQMNGPRATLILDIKTESSPRAQNHRKLAGQIRTEWRLETGWVLRKWEIVETENISMKYKDTPKPFPDNSNRPPVPSS